MNEQTRYNVVVKNWQGRVIAGRTGIRSQKQAERLAEMYMQDPKVGAVNVVPFEVEEKQGNGRYR